MRRLYIIFICLLMAFPVIGKQLQFDSQLMQANGISAEQLDDAINYNVIPIGMSWVDVFINNKFVAHGEINQFKGITSFSKKLKLSLGLKSYAWQAVQRQQDKNFYSISPIIKQTYSRSDKKLSLQVPVEYLVNPLGRVKISGGQGVFINYNAFSYRYKDKNTSLNNTNVNYQAGMNLNNVIIRANGNFSSFQTTNHTNIYPSSRSQPNHFAATHYNNKRSEINDFYAERDFSSTRVRMGRTLVNDGGFGTGYIDGAMVSSTEGNANAFVDFSYNAPEVTTVEFWQGNLLVWKQTVQKGYAELKNIPVSSFTDDVMVLIKLNNRVIDSKIINKAQISSVRHGITGYYAFSGKTTQNRRQMVSGMGFSKSFNRYVQPSIAIAIKSRYRGVTLSNSTQIGQFRTGAWLSTVENEKKQKSASINLTASINNTSISYAYNSQNFTYIDQAYDGNYKAQRSNIGISQGINLSHDIFANFGMNHYDFYKGKSYNSLSTSINMPIKRARLTLGASFMSLAQGQNQRNKVNLNVSFSMPLTLGSRTINYRSQYYSLSQNKRLTNYLTAPVSDIYTVSLSHSLSQGVGSKDKSTSLENSILTPYTNADLSVGQGSATSGHSNTMSAFFSGAMAINKQGIIFTPERISDTYAVVNTGVHQFLRIDSAQSSVISNHDGKAIISALNPTKDNYIRINPEGLKVGTVIKNNLREFSVERGSVSYFEFSSVKNNNLLLAWDNLPSGIVQSDVFYNASGKIVARFIDKGILLINEEDLNNLREMGMTSPKNINQICKLTTDKLNSEEAIKHVIFHCGT